MNYKWCFLLLMYATTAMAQGVIDVHSHLIPSEFTQALKQEGRLMEEGFPIPHYDVEQHLKTDHFQKYKQGTLHMVKNLKLPTMQPLDPETMKQIFKKQR